MLSYFLGEVQYLHGTDAQSILVRTRVHTIPITVSLVSSGLI
jgi:hypothetical protein